ncbi:MAG: DUF4249 family protein [Bacteroidia bacterium]|nr:DUF4249 family protein [Bacteroidia bacterium]
MKLLLQKRTYLVAALIVFLFNSCKNDLKIIAPYKEIPYVYAILTPQEKMQMIRINKVFLGEGDANQMAKVADSVNYKSGELTVKLERFFNGVKVAAASTPTGDVMDVFFRDSVIQTLPGAFNTNQRVYLANEKLFTYGVYKLTIKNNTTGNEFTASANAIDSVPPSLLPPFAPPYYPVPYSPSNPASYYVNYSNLNAPPFTIRTKAAPGAFLHDLTIRVHYYDSMAGAPNYKLYNYLDYVFNPQQLKEQVLFSNNLYFNFSFSAPNMFLEFGNMMAKRGNPFGLLGRKTYKIDFISYAVTQDYYDYLQFAAPSLSFAQEKILYSNFDKKAALGIFTFRSRCHISKEMYNPFIDAFATNPNTCRFKFYESDLDPASCP